MPGLLQHFSSVSTRRGERIALISALFMFSVLWSESQRLQRDSLSPT